MSASWPSRYVGLPFDDRDGAGGAHCWGLVRRVFAAERGIELPPYGEISASDMVAIAKKVGNVASPDGPWRAVERGAEQEFDVVVMTGPVDEGGRLRRAPNHVGIVAPELTLLHVERATAAVCVPLRHPSVRSRYLTCYRYAA